MSALIEVSAEFRQVRVCRRPDLNVSPDTNGAEVDNLVEPRPFLGLPLDGEDILSSRFSKPDKLKGALLFLPFHTYHAIIRGSRIKANKKAG